MYDLKRYKLLFLSPILVVENPVFEILEEGSRNEKGSKNYLLYILVKFSSSL